MVQSPVPDGQTRAVRPSHKGPGIAAVPGSDIKRAGERAGDRDWLQSAVAECTPVRLILTAWSTAARTSSD